MPRHSFLPGRTARRQGWRRRGVTGLLVVSLVVNALPPPLLAQAPPGTGAVPPPPTPLMAVPGPSFPAPPGTNPLAGLPGANRAGSFVGQPVSSPAPALLAPPAAVLAPLTPAQLPAMLAPSQGQVMQAPADGPALTPAEVQRMIDAAIRKDREEQKKAEEEKTNESPWYTVGSKLGGNATWRNGFWFETPNKDFTFHLGGAVQYELATYTNDQNLNFGPHAIGPFQDGVNLRRGRLRAEGTAYEVVDYRFELEFANGVTPPGAPAGVGRATQAVTFLTPGPTDAWATLTHLPVVGNLRIGNMKEPISLEHLESYLYLPFMERSPLFDLNTPTAFNNGFTPGIMLFNTAFDERMTWAIGGFKNSYDVYGFGLGDGEYAATGRLTWLPWYEEDGKCMVHLGISGSHRDPIGEQVRFRARTSVQNAPTLLTPFVNILVDTGFFNTTAEDILGLEFFANLGPLTVQAEYLGTWCQNSALAPTGAPAGPNMGTTFFSGAYVQALYWLTGEYTRWDRKAAVPAGYVVNSPFYLLNGVHGLMASPGAWQVGVRYSYVDDNSKGISGGTLSDLTVGLNWILNQNMKLQWNYDWAFRGGFDTASNGNIHAFGMRMQFNF
jgi:phosphate-selective porin OprO/OprP